MWEITISTVTTGTATGLRLCSRPLRILQRALMEIGQDLGVEDFTRYQEEFGFGKQTGIDLPGEQEGVLYTKRTWMLPVWLPMRLGRTLM